MNVYLVNQTFERGVQLAGLGHRGRMRGLGRLGDASSQQVQVDTSDVLNLGDNLRAAQSRLNAIEDQMRQDPDLARAIGANVTAQQAALGDLISKYVGVYTAIFGQAPAGLGNPVLVAAAVAVILAYVTAQLYLWHQKQNVLETQAQAQIAAEQNRGAIIAMAQQKQSDSEAAARAGDSAGAADAQAAAMALLQQAGIPGSAPPPPPQNQTLTDWIKANWIPVAGIAAAIVFVPRLMR